MNENKMKKWEQMRKNGPWKYGLIYGSIWGVFVVAFVFVVNSFLHFDERLATVKGLLMMLVIYVLTGIILYRFFMWKVNENRYKIWKDMQNK